MKTLTFSLVKDISYKYKGFTDLNEDSICGAKNIVSLINASKMMSIDGKAVDHSAVSVSNFRYPWDRAFEATFDINVA